MKCFLAVFALCFLAFPSDVCFAAHFRLFSARLGRFSSPYSPTQWPRAVERIVSHNTTTAAEQAYIEANYASSQSTYNIHRYTPRFSYPNNFSTVTGKSETGSVSTNLINYAIGVGILGGIGILFFLLTLGAWNIFCCLRCCRCCNCCKCCAGSKDDAILPHEAKRRIRMVIAVTVLCAFICAVGIVGVVQNEQIHSDISSDSGLVNSIANTMLDLNNFINEVVAPAIEILNNVPGVANQISAILNATESTVSNGFTEVINQLNAEAGYLRNYSFTAAGYTYACAYCNNAANQVNSVTANIQNTSSSTISSLNNVLSSSQNTLVSIVNTIQSDINSVINNLQSAQQGVMNAYYNYNAYTKNIAGWDNDRRIGSLVLLLFPSLFFLLSLFGFFFRKPIAYRIMYWFSFLIMALVWLVFAASLPLSATISDQCVYLDSLQPNLYPIVDSNVATIFTACLTNTSLTGPSVFNVSDDLNFATLITFPPAVKENASQYLTFSAFTSFFTNVTTNVNPGTFGLNEATLILYLDTLNAGCSQNYTVNQVNYTFPTSADCPNTPNLTNARDLVYNYSEWYNTSESFSKNLSTNVTKISNLIQNISNNIADAQSQILKIQTLLTPIQNPANQLIDLAICGFLGHDYAAIKNKYCNDICYDLGIIAMCCFMIGVICIPITVLSTKIANLDERHGVTQQKISMSKDPLADPNSSVPLNNLTKGNSADPLLMAGSSSLNRPPPGFVPPTDPNAPFSPYAPSNGAGMRPLNGDSAALAPFPPDAQPPPPQYDMSAPYASAADAGSSESLQKNRSVRRSQRADQPDAYEGTQ